MNLPRDGLFWRLLIVYGYSESRLEKGISLCQAFWSIVAGLPVKGLWNAN